MQILLDVTRTLVHSRKRTPTGIDRVEHAYIRYLLAQGDDADVWFIANTPVGRGALSRRQMNGIFQHIETRQRGAVSAQGKSTVFQALAEALAAPPGSGRTAPLSIRPRLSVDRDSRLTVLHGMLRGAAQFRRLMRARKPCVYLHTSHLQLDEPNCFEWLRRPEVCPVFFVHDLIPIEYPEFCGPSAAPRHARRVETVMDHAQALLVNSAFTRDSLARHLGNRPLPPSAVVPLANTIRDQSHADATPMSLAVPFFLHVGTLEGRKNIGHLLAVWRHLIGHMGPQVAPRLVLVGKRGWECENVIDILDRSRELADHVIEVSGVDDAGLKNLMRHAAGLITVSVTEGYGLPPVEAVRLGLPVIASDIPAHREILGAACDFVPLHDGEALARKIMALMSSDKQYRSGAIPVLDWNEHVERALAFIKEEFRKGRGRFGERSVRP